jgi:hypothetical protein
MRDGPGQAHQFTSRAANTWVFFWLARLWHRARLPIPVDWITGPIDLFHSPDFTLPPTRRGTRTLLTVHDLSFVR